MGLGIDVTAGSKERLESWMSTTGEGMSRKRTGVVGYGVAGQVQERPVDAFTANIFWKTSILCAERANIAQPSLILPTVGGINAGGIEGSAEIHLSFT